MIEPASLARILPPRTGVCVINLDSRPDRWEAIQSHLLPLLEPLPVSRIPAVVGTELPGYGVRPYFRGKKRDRTWAGRAGCTLSHRRALLHALEQRWDYVLVFEDDAILYPPAQTALATPLADALPHASLHFCYLGFADPLPPFREIARLGDSPHSLHQIFGANTAHAYILSTHAAKVVLGLLPQRETIWPWLARHRAIDRFLRRNLSAHLTVTAVSPPFFDQAAGHSNITGRPTQAPSLHHVTSIPAASTHPAAFEAARRHRLRRTRRENAWDAARGLLKRLKGF